MDRTSRFDPVGVLVVLVVCSGVVLYLDIPFLRFVESFLEISMLCAVLWLAMLLYDQWHYFRVKRRIQNMEIEYRRQKLVSLSARNVAVDTSLHVPPRRRRQSYHWSDPNGC